MLAPVLIVLALLAIVFLIVVANRPSEFGVMRVETMATPPETVFALVNDLHAWEAWSPWAKLDPNARNTYEGPAAGAGAVFAWAGNNKIGEGRMTISESRPPELVRLRLDFAKPFKVTNTAEFTFKADGNQTLVRWTMTGKNNFICKAMGLFFSFDKMVGGQFEKGLADLKRIAESAGRKAALPVARV